MTVLGGASYLLTAMANFPAIASTRVRLSGPGLAWEGEFLVLAVGKRSAFGIEDRFDGLRRQDLGERQAVMLEEGGQDRLETTGGGGE